jgi:hypothetical protein
MAPFLAPHIPFGLYRILLGVIIPHKMNTFSRLKPLVDGSLFSRCESRRCITNNEHVHHRIICNQVPPIGAVDLASKRLTKNFCYVYDIYVKKSQLFDRFVRNLRTLKCGLNLSINKVI